METLTLKTDLWTREVLQRERVGRAEGVAWEHIPYHTQNRKSWKCATAQGTQTRGL